MTRNSRFNPRVNQCIVDVRLHVRLFPACPQNREDKTRDELITTFELWLREHNITYVSSQYNSGSYTLPAEIAASVQEWIAANKVEVITQDDVNRARVARASRMKRLLDEE